MKLTTALLALAGSINAVIIYEMFGKKLPMGTYGTTNKLLKPAPESSYKGTHEEYLNGVGKSDGFKMTVPYQGWRHRNWHSSPFVPYNVWPAEIDRIRCDDCVHVPGPVDIQCLPAELGVTKEETDGAIEMFEELCDQYDELRLSRFEHVFALYGRAVAYSKFGKGADSRLSVDRCANAVCSVQLPTHR